MPSTASANANLGNVPHLGQERSASIKITKSLNAYRPQSAKVDFDLAEKQSLKAKSPVRPRQSIAALVNQDKGHIGKKVDMTV